MIQIKTFYNGWKTVDKETAKRWIESVSKGAIAIKNKELYFNKRLYGITYKELMKDDV